MLVVYFCIIIDLMQIFSQNFFNKINAMATRKFQKGDENGKASGNNWVYVRAPVQLFLS